MWARLNRFPDWFVLAVSLFLAVAIALTAEQLNDVAQKARRTQLLSAQLDALADEDNSAIYEALAKSSIDIELRVQIATFDHEIEEKIDEIRANDPDAGTSLSIAFELHEQRFHQALDLIQGGNTQAALQFFEESDASVEAFDSQVERIVAEYGVRASRAERTLVLGMTLLTLLMAVTVGGLSWGLSVMRRRAERRLSYLAAHDTLTGLPNRSSFETHLEGAMVRAAMHRAQVALLFVDIDRFKESNDTLGHRAGDQVLAVIGDRLRAALRAGDRVARLGGDEFTVVLETISGKDEVTAFAARVMQLLLVPIELPDNDITVTASIGIAFASAGSADDLLRDADTAMYEAKRLGRSRIAVFETGMALQSAARLTIESELRHGIAMDQFEVYYQPIVHLETGEIGGVEALLRWNHPRRGVLQPDAFLDVAEESGLIVPLGNWVLASACRQMRSWHKQCPDRKLPVLSVNLSPRELSNASLVSTIKQTLLETGLDPRYVRLDLSERAAALDVEPCLTVMHALKALGVQLALDDFGSGLAGLSSLKKLPLDWLNIGRPKIATIDQRPEDAAIVKAVINVAAALNLNVTVEGIETPSQAAELRKLHCEWRQGFLYARPVPVDKITAWIAAGHIESVPGRAQELAPAHSPANPLSALIPRLTIVPASSA